MEGGWRGRLTDKRGEDLEPSLQVLHPPEGGRRRLSAFGLAGPPEVLQNVFDGQPKAVEQEERAGDGVPSEVGHGSA